MKLPSKDFKIKIGPFDVKVERSDDNSFERNVYGEFHSTTLTIKLQKSMLGEDRILDTFIHEVMHGLCHVYSIDFEDRHIKEEEAVTRMSTAWYTFQKENKFLF